MKIPDLYPGGPLRQSWVDHLINKHGITEVEDTLYSTSLSADELRVIAHWAKNLEGTSMVQYGVLEKDVQIIRYGFTRNVAEGEVLRRFIKQECMLRGNFLRISEGVPSAEARTRFRSSVSSFLARAFILAGRGAILSELCQLTIRLPDQEAFSSTPQYSYVPGDDAASDWYRVSTPALGVANDLPYCLSESAAKFWIQASQTGDRAISFLFLWIALEAQIGKGKERAQFCISELKSQSASDAMNEVRSARDALVHDGRRGAITCDHYEILHALLRISALRDCSLRRQLLQDLEVAYEKVSRKCFGSILSEFSNEMTFQLDKLSPEVLNSAASEEVVSPDKLMTISVYEEDQ